MKYSHSLWGTLRSLKGNQKACVVSEPLWAIPSNLFAPFASIYMAAIGLLDAQIGALVSFALALQLLWGLLSGAIVDKYGRRRMMLVFGLISWSLPCVLWATARSYPYFLAAVFFNSTLQVINNSFSCMIVEDGDTEKLVHIYTILNLTGLIAGFLSPVAGLCIDRFTLVPTMRVIYLLSTVLMTAKFLLQFCLARESAIGKKRMSECRGKSVFSLTFGGCGAVVRALVQPRLLPCVLLGTALTCYNTVQATFWPLFVTKAYGVSPSLLSVFPLLASLTSIAVYMLITPRIKIRSARLPLFAGLGLHALGLFALLSFLPSAGSSLWAVFFSAVCEALALALLGPLFESIMSVVIPSGDRARINSLIFAVIFLISMPAGWVAGFLSQHNRALPMVMNLFLLFAALPVTLVILRRDGAVQRQ